MIGVEKAYKVGSCISSKYPLDMPRIQFGDAVPIKTSRKNS